MSRLGFYQITIFYLILFFILVSLGREAIFATYVICVQSHFLLCYQSSLKLKYEIILPFIALSAILVLLYLSPLSTDNIAVISSLVFAHHFWRDEIDILNEKVFKSWRGVILTCGIIAIVVITLLLGVSSKNSNIFFFLEMAQIPYIYMLLVIYHVTRWYFFLHRKYLIQSSDKNKKFLIKIFALNLCFIILYFSTNTQFFGHKFFFGIRESFVWALLHMLFSTYHRYYKNNISVKPANIV